jgi:hypothetical protein
MTNETNATPDTLTSANITVDIFNEAKRASSHANAVLADLQKKVQQEKYEAAQRAERAVAEKYDAEMKEVSTAAWDARKWYEQAKLAFALSGSACALPVGTQFVKWTEERYYDSTTRSSGYKWVAGIVGHVEVLTDLSSISDRMTNRYGRNIKVGDVIIRPVLKSGKPGRDVITLKADGTPNNGYAQTQGVWYLAGLDANVEQAKERAAREAYYEKLRAEREAEKSEQK